MLILGIESSCDETAAALLEVKQGKFNLLSNVVSSSVKLQAKYGGVVPEVAARQQVHYIIPVIEQALLSGISKLQNTNYKQIYNSKSKNLKHKTKLPITYYGSLVDAIAVTLGGPGLATSMQVGIDAAKTLAYAWQKPIIPVIHMEGHAYSALLKPGKSKLEALKFPAIVLTVSGGHTVLLLLKDYLKHKLLGQTRDDAAGEAYDKIAKLLGLGYPGGPIISKLAANGDPKAFNFPRGMLNSGDFNFSFSGLKTAVLYKIKEMSQDEVKKRLNDICASFQQAIIDVLIDKTLKAAKAYKAKNILLGGGVAANKLLRDSLITENDQRQTGAKVLIPAMSLTTDNAAMIALAGYFHYQAGDFIRPDPQTKAWQRLSAEPRLRIV